MASKTLNKTASDPAYIDHMKLDFNSAQREGMLFGLEELPKFLKTVIGHLENSGTFKENGHVWFYLDTKGTRMDGYYRFNINGKTLEEMFVKLENNESNPREPIDQFDDIANFKEKARFTSGKQRLTVGIYRDDLGEAYVQIVGSPENEVAPVTVFKNLAVLESETATDGVKGVAGSLLRG